MTKRSFAVRHSCDSQEWYTPMPIVDAARAVFGGRIDLDPASHPEANALIRSKRIFSKKQNGLRRKWRGSVLVNPPAGLVSEFWVKLLREYEAGNIKEAVWVGYSIEQIQTLQNAPGATRTPVEFATCWPRKRIAFTENASKRRARMKKLRSQGKKPNSKSQPAHGNYITYLGRRRATFAREFSQFGKVIVG